MKQMETRQDNTVQCKTRHYYTKSRQYSTKPRQYKKAKQTKRQEKTSAKTRQDLTIQYTTSKELTSKQDKANTIQDNTNHNTR